jgi:signal transduction histidine kinase
MKPIDAIIAQNREIRSIESGRLFRKYFLLILGLVCGALLLSGAIGLYFSYQENQIALSSLQREKAVSAAARIEQFVRQIEQQLAFAALPQLGASGMEQRRFEFDKLIRMASEVTDIAHIDAKGKEQLAVSRLSMNVAGSNRDRSQELAFRNAKPGQTWFSPVYFRKETEPYMSIAVRSGGPAGAVTVADVNLKFMWDVVTRIKVGKKGKAYVVDGTGHLVADPDIGLVLRKTDLSQLPQVRYALEKDAPESFALVAKDLAGVSVLTAYASIDAGARDLGARNVAPLGWKVFVEQPTVEVFETLNATIIRTASLIVAGLMISALAALWLARSMVRPIRTLQEGAARIGAGQLEQDIHIRTGDELEALANQFNQMSAQLRESYAGLEKKVEARTAELSETLKQQTATSEILRVISGTITDTQPVFEAIVKSCLGLFAGSRVSIGLERDGFYEVKARASAFGDIASTTDRVPIDKKSGIGRCILESRAIHIADTEKASSEFPRSQELALARGYRSVLCVPLKRDGKAIGALSVIRPEAGAFTDKEVALLGTFADQAVIAIQNVHLFKEIQDTSRQLEIANRHKSEFLANMSHELRTPLNAIIGFSEVLVEKMFGEVNDKQLDYLKDIHSSGKHLLSLINDILDLSKIEAGRMELDLAEFDLRAALQNAITLVKERAQRNGITLRLDVDDAPGAFRADERKFKQIMLNLLSNAVKFTPEGGKVSVRARSTAGAVEFAVEDTGVGIAVEDQQMVFEEFRQVGRDYTRKAEGTGLGLALTKRFIELHGGALRLESAPGKGSTFTFTIPVRT